MKKPTKAEIIEALKWLAEEPNEERGTETGISNANKVLAKLKGNSPCLTK